MIPVKIYSLEDHVKRWPKAVAEVIDTESVILGLESALCERENNIFDFPNGVRLVAGRENAYCEPHLKVGPRLHVCAIVQPGSNIQKMLAALPKKKALDALEIAISNLFVDLSGLRLPLVRQAYPGLGGVVHWMVEPDPYLESKNGSAPSDPDH